MAQKITNPSNWGTLYDNLTVPKSGGSTRNSKSVAPRSPYLGLLLPVQKGGNGYFKSTKVAIEQAQSNLINLIMTKKGERIMHPDFGCNIHNILFEEITDNIVASARGSILEATQMWLPYIAIKNIQIDKYKDTNRIHLTIQFNLKSAPTYSPGVIDDATVLMVI